MQLFRNDLEGNFIERPNRFIVIADSGIYMVLIEINEYIIIPTGKLPYSEYKAGYYVYSGSAKQNLSKRVKRHMNRKKKNFHWHIDYLTAKADNIKTYPIYTGKFTECDAARGLSEIGGSPVPGFGSSDCKCGSHLHYFNDNPERKESFLKLLHHFRHNF